MRVLFVDAKVHFLNRTRELVPLMWAGAANVEFFGPGYVTPSVLRRGLGPFTVERGPFDLVATTEFGGLADHWNEASVYQLVSKTHRLSFPRELLATCPRTAEELQTLGLPTVLTTLETDYYSVSNQWLDAVDRFDFVVGWGAQFVRPKGSMVNLEAEHFGQRVNDNWLTYAEQRQEKLIPLLHFVGPSEIDRCPRRRWKVSVPGILYSERARVRNLLKRHELLRESARRWRLFMGAAGRLVPVLRPYSRAWGQAFLRERFDDEIRHSVASFTDGSTLAWPIRKYFEIPGLGTPLLCQPFEGFSAAGFRDGVNCLVTHSEDLLRTYEMLTGSPSIAGNLAARGPDFVARTHSLTARSEQLRRILDRIGSGNYKGAYWQCGELLLK